MEDSLFPRFLESPNEYKKARGFWDDLWDSITPLQRAANGWVSPWMASSPEFNDGNPIFSAYSPTLSKAIRIIQFLPDPEAPEFIYWFDTFGGEITDPQTLLELVISCHLTYETANQAAIMMESWIAGAPNLPCKDGDKFFTNY